MTSPSRAVRGGGQGRDELPESQRPTIPSPQPFKRIVELLERAPSPGAYRIIVDGEAREELRRRG